MGEREKREGLVYSAIGTGVELKTWTLITDVPESKGGSHPGYRSGLNSLYCQLF